RKWFGHDPAKWTEFQKRYRAEVKENAEPLTALKREAKAGLGACRDEKGPSLR
ncbi:MAG TPA: DUF488 family protein, partial [Candidatus Angelobacter sp.]|nr:DUF488 family protein [Candidatus Angelobacter sp.]